MCKNWPTNPHMQCNFLCLVNSNTHYSDVIMGTIASQITSLTTVFSAVYSDADQRKHQSSASLAFVRGVPRGPVNSPHKWPVTRKMFPFDDVLMQSVSFGMLSRGPIEQAVTTKNKIDGLVQERRNSISMALELRLSCTNQSQWNKDVSRCHWCEGTHYFIVLDIFSFFVLIMH